MSQSPPTESRAAAPSATGPAAVELLGITKRFPGVVANDHVDLALLHGEVHCLLGENGAGKSTLMSILSGMVSPDAGRIKVDGREVRIDSPQRALELGIGMVYQHSMLIPALTVLENLMLGESRALRLPVEPALARFAELAATLGVQIDPHAATHTLALGQQQQVEIIKALWRGSRVLILDEPTSMLTPQAVRELQSVLARLREHGLAIVFITHKLHEAVALGDRITVLRQGRVTGSIEREQIHRSTPEQLESEIVRLMFGEGGESVAAEVAELQIGVLEGEKRADASAAEVALELQNASAAG